MPDRDAGLLIVDVDNTIYDWLGIWARAFGAMTHTLATDTASDVPYWHAALRSVHIRRHALECPGALADLQNDASWTIAVTRDRVLARAAYVYRRIWDTHLTPYEGVREALVRLTENGWRIVAYSESDAAVTAARLCRMGLAGVIPRVFGRAPFSAPVRREWSLVEMPARLPIAIDHVPRADMKPNPAGLRGIVSRCGGTTSRTVYAGDNLRKDIAMAQRLGVRALWAKYGTTRHTEHADLLASVGHWSPADVLQEREAAMSNITPDATLETASELAHATSARCVEVG
jgi:phosphoglycolate phosphatase-like HAD superfamily hydrolase